MSLKTDRVSFAQSFLLLLFYSGLQDRIGTLTLVKVIYFAHSTNSNVNLILKQHHRHTRVTFGSIAGHPRAQSS